jgi:hypothetical protein
LAIYKMIIMGHKASIKHQYNETNMMHFSFRLLRIKSLYVLSITGSSSGAATQTALGILCAAYNVSWL